MSKTALRREPFDPAREFAVNKRIKFNGNSLGHGDSFDKSAVTTRTLRQLYDNRTLVMTTTVADAPSIDLNKMSEKQLWLLLEDNGIVPRFGAGRKWLLKRAEQFMSVAA